MKKTGLMTGILLILAAFMLSACSGGLHQARQSSKMDKRTAKAYDNHRQSALRYVEVGDFESAIADIEAALKINDEDPALYEVLALAYDGDRQNDRAYGHFLQAGRMYIDAGDIDKAWRVQGWLSAYSGSQQDPLAIEFESQLRRIQKNLNATRIN